MKATDWMGALWPNPGDADIDLAVRLRLMRLMRNQADFSVLRREIGDALRESVRTELRNWRLHDG